MYYAGLNYRLKERVTTLFRTSSDFKGPISKQNVNSCISKALDTRETSTYRIGVITAQQCWYP